MVQCQAPAVGTSSSFNFTLDSDLLQAINAQVLMPDMLQKLRTCFDKIRETPTGLPEGQLLGDDEISSKQVNFWLQMVNRKIGRGSEYRLARWLQCLKQPG